jgi:hypothetical protein
VPDDETTDEQVPVRVPVSYEIAPGFAGEHEVLFLILDGKDPAEGDIDRVLYVLDSADARTIGSELRSKGAAIQTIADQTKENDDSGN